MIWHWLLLCESFEWPSIFCHFCFRSIVNVIRHLHSFVGFCLYRFRFISSKISSQTDSKQCPDKWKQAYFVKCTIWFGDLIVTFRVWQRHMHATTLFQTGVYVSLNVFFDHRLIFSTRTSFLASLSVSLSLFFAFYITLFLLYRVWCLVFFCFLSLISAFNRANCLLNCLSAVTTSEYIDIKLIKKLFCQQWHSYLHSQHFVLLWTMMSALTLIR